MSEGHTWNFHVSFMSRVSSCDQNFWSNPAGHSLVCKCLEWWDHTFWCQWWSDHLRLRVIYVWTRLPFLYPYLCRRGGSSPCRRCCVSVRLTGCCWVRVPPEGVSARWFSPNTTQVDRLSALTPPPSVLSAHSAHMLNMQRSPAAPPCVHSHQRATVTTVGRKTQRLQNHSQAHKPEAALVFFLKTNTGLVKPLWKLSSSGWHQKTAEWKYKLLQHTSTVIPAVWQFSHHTPAISWIFL